MIRNKNLQKMSKKNLIRMIDDMEDAYLEAVRIAQMNTREGQMNYARLVAVLDSVGGEVTLSADRYEELPLDRAVVHTVPNEDQTESTFTLEFVEVDDDEE